MMYQFKIGFTFTLLLLGAYNSFSQEVISTAGNYSKSNSGSVSWVLGEVIQSNMATLSNESNKAENTQNTNTDLSVDMNENKIECLIYPNPFTDYISISIHNIDIENCNLHIYNIQGELIYTEFIYQNSTLIPVKELAVGNYFVQVKTEKYNSEVYKIIKSE